MGEMDYEKNFKPKRFKPHGGRVIHKMHGTGSKDGLTKAFCGAVFTKVTFQEGESTCKKCISADHLDYWFQLGWAATKYMWHINHQEYVADVKSSCYDVRGAVRADLLRRTSGEIEGKPIFAYVLTARGKLFQQMKNDGIRSTGVSEDGVVHVRVLSRSYAMSGSALCNRYMPLKTPYEKGKDISSMSLYEVLDLAEKYKDEMVTCMACLAHE